MQKRNIVILIMSLVLLFGISGCGRQEQESGNSGTVLKFAGTDISIGEVYVYANTVSEQYEKSYGENVWDMEVPISETETDTMKNLTRKDIIENIVRVKVLVSKAGEYDVRLSPEDDEKIMKQAEAFYKNLTDDQIEKMQLSRDVIITVYKENEIASRVYDRMMDKAGIEVSDEDARQTTIYDLVFEKYTVDVSGNVKELSQDEKDAQYERALQAYNTLVNPVSGSDNTNIEGLAEFYGAADSRYYTLSPDEIREMYGQEIGDMIYSLDDGSYSLVTESEYGYHIFYIQALTDREATNKLKQTEISSKQKAYFTSCYEKWLKELDPNYSYEKSVDDDVYSKIKF